MQISKLLVGLGISMASLVAISNFLVQYPVKYFGMENILTYAAFTYPITFLVNGKWGKTLNQNLRRVSSLRLAPFFKNNFNLNIFLLLSLNGLHRTKPACPKIILFLDKNVLFIFLILWRDLNLNFRGCNTKKTSNLIINLT